MSASRTAAALSKAAAVSMLWAPHELDEPKDDMQEAVSSFEAYRAQELLRLQELTTRNEQRADSRRICLCGFMLAARKDAIDPADTSTMIKT